MRARAFLCLALFTLVLAFLPHNVQSRAKIKCRQPKKGSKKEKDECTSVSGKKPDRSPNVPPALPKKPLMYSYEILDTIERDGSIFTQGLEIWKPCASCRESMFSSSGLHGESFIVEKDLKTGKTLQSKDLPKEDFGEGLTILDKKLYQVVWQTRKLYVYDVDNFENVETKEHSATDGWGLANDGKHLIISDGTDILTFVEPDEPENFVKLLSITFDGTPVTDLNELEWIDGVIYANVWKSDCIAKINPENGEVFGWIDASGLRKLVVKQVEKERGQSDSDYTLNGIAVRPGTATPMYVTGKLWPKAYLIEEKVMNGGKPMTDTDIKRAKDTCLV